MIECPPPRPPRRFKKVFLLAKELFASLRRYGHTAMADDLEKAVAEFNCRAEIGAANLFDEEMLNQAQNVLRLHIQDVECAQFYDDALPESRAA